MNALHINGRDLTLEAVREVAADRRDLYAQAVAYFEKTRLFPIMHCVALKRALYEQHPWVAQNLMKALEASKRLAVELAYDFNALRYTLPWLIPTAPRRCSSSSHWAARFRRSSRLSDRIWFSTG